MYCWLCCRLYSLESSDGSCRAGVVIGVVGGLTGGTEAVVSGVQGVSPAGGYAMIDVVCSLDGWCEWLAESVGALLADAVADRVSASVCADVVSSSIASIAVSASRIAIVASVCGAGAFA